MQILVFPAVPGQKKAHTCSQWVQVQHKNFRIPKFMSDVPERHELITAHLTPTHLLPSPLFLQAFVTIPAPPSHPELICAPSSHSTLSMANSIQAVEGERPWPGDGEVGKSWVRTEQLQCYSKRNSTPPGNQESLRASVLYRRATYCSQSPLGGCCLNQWIHWKLHLFHPSEGLDKTTVWFQGQLSQALPPAHSTVLEKNSHP